MGVNGELYKTAALLPVRFPGAHRIGGCLGPRVGVEDFDKGNFLPITGKKLRVLHYTFILTLTTLFLA